MRNDGRQGRVLPDRVGQRRRRSLLLRSRPPGDVLEQRRGAHHRVFGRRRHRPFVLRQHPRARRRAGIVALPRPLPHCGHYRRWPAERDPGLPPSQAGPPGACRHQDQPDSLSRGPHPGGGRDLQRQLDTPRRSAAARRPQCGERDRRADRHRQPQGHGRPPAGLPGRPPHPTRTAPCSTPTSTTSRS